MPAHTGKQYGLVANNPGKVKGIGPFKAVAKGFASKGTPKKRSIFMKKKKNSGYY